MPETADAATHEPTEGTSLIDSPCGCWMLWTRATNKTVHFFCPTDEALRTSTVRQVKEDQDSLTWGTPGSGGECKVYGDADDPTTFERRIKALLELRDKNLPRKEPKG